MTALVGPLVVDLRADPERAVVRGRGGADLAREAGAWPVWVGTVRGWVVEERHVGELLALAQHRGVRHRVLERQVPR